MAVQTRHRKRRGLLAAGALTFTKTFVADAKTLYVQDIRMESSADTTALSDIISDRGSLERWLKGKGGARADTVPADVSWCN